MTKPKRKPPRIGKRGYPKTARARKPGTRGPKAKPKPTRADESTKRPREILNDSELRRLLAACGDKPNGLRDRALLSLLEGTGCRISEALDLEPRDLDFESEEANIRHGKGDKQRTVPVAPDALQACRVWLEARAELGIGKRAPICCNLDGDRLSTQYVRRRLGELAATAEIDKRVHAHGFRHRFTIRMQRKGVPLTSISYVLGHSQTATTHEYMRRIGADPAIADVRRAQRSP